MVQVLNCSSGSVFTKISQEQSLSFSPRFVNLTQLLTGYTVWFSQSEAELHSNTSNYRNIWRIGQRTF